MFNRIFLEAHGASIIVAVIIMYCIIMLESLVSSIKARYNRKSLQLNTNYKYVLAIWRYLKFVIFVHLKVYLF